MTDGFCYAHFLSWSTVVILEVDWLTKVWDCADRAFVICNTDPVRQADNQDNTVQC